MSEEIKKDVEEERLESILQRTRSSGVVLTTLVITLSSGLIYAGLNEKTPKDSGPGWHVIINQGRIRK